MEKTYDPKYDQQKTKGKDLNMYPNDMKMTNKPFLVIPSYILNRNANVLTKDMN